MAGPPELTAARVGERLEGLREVYRLCMSLATARCGPIPPELFRARSLGVEAMALPSARAHGDARVARAPGSACDVELIAAPAATTHPVGEEFDLILTTGPPESVVDVRGVLVGVLSAGGAFQDRVDPGGRVRIRLRFLGGLPGPVSALPVLDSPDGRIRLWLATRQNWRRRRRE